MLKPFSFKASENLGDMVYGCMMSELDNPRQEGFDCE